MPANQFGTAGSRTRDTAEKKGATGVSPAPRGQAALTVLVLTGLLISGGCGSDTASKPPPEVFAVTGTITDASGTSVTAGMLEFRSTTGAESSAQADIQPDGTFTAFTLFEGEKLAGAAAGEYNATFYPPMSQSQTEVPVSLSEPFVVEKKENRFEVKLP